MFKPTRIHSSAIVYFNAVRRAGSIREAARQLNVASSAVNRQILKLEEEVGLPLFERLATGVRMTAAGEALARHVIAVIQDSERLGIEIDQIVGAQAGHVSVAAAEGICTSVIPAVVTALKQRVPKATFSIRRMGSLDIADAVLEGEVDIGIAFDLVLPAGLKNIASSDYALGAIMHPCHSLSSQPIVSLTTCLQYPLIFAEAGLSIGQLLAPALLRLRAAPTPVISSNSIEMIREFVKSGAGIAFQTRFGLDADLAAGDIVYIPIDQNGLIVSTVSVFVRSNRSLPPLLELFAKQLADNLYAREDVAAARALMPKRHQGTR